MERRRTRSATRGAGRLQGDVTLSEQVLEPAEPRTAERPSRLSLLMAFGAIAVVGVVIPLVFANHYGAIGVPRNDDWSYLRTLFHWVDTGSLDFNRWVSMTLFGQLVIAAPLVWLFGHDIAAVQVLTALLGFAGLLAVLWIGCIVVRTFWLAVFVAVLVAGGPLWGALSVSFMTDVPAFALAMIACALGVRAFRDRPVSFPFLVAGLAAAFAGSTIRQYGAVPLVALVLVGGWSLWQDQRRRNFWQFAMLSAAVGVALVALALYWQTVPNGRSVAPGLPTAHSVGVTFYKGAGLIRLLGLLLAPVIVLAGPVQIVRRSWLATRSWTVLVCGGAGIVLVFTALRSSRAAFVGNYVGPDGVLSQGLIGGTRPDILPPGAFVFLVLVGIVGGVLLLLALIPAFIDARIRWRAASGSAGGRVSVLVSLVVLGYLGAYFLAAMAGLQISDRYVLPIVPLVSLLLVRHRGGTRGEAIGRLRSSARRGAIAGGIALTALTVVGLVFTADSASFDGTRWRVAVAATRLGWRPDQIAGGWEWVNYHARGAPVAEKNGGVRCVRVTLNPRGGVHARNVVAYRYYRSPLIDPVPVVAVRTARPCATRPAKKARSGP